MTGIYKITNLVNGNAYIGQSVDIEKRFKDHKYRAFVNYPSNRDYEKALYRAFRKYGIENFKFEVLEICQVSELNDKEINYIKLYDTYNNGYIKLFHNLYLMDNSQKLYTYGL